MSIELQHLRFSEAASAITDLWLSLPRAAGTPCPQKADFSPVRLGKYLSSVLLYELTDQNRLMVRVAGTRVCEIFGKEITGEPLLEVAPPEFSREYQTFYEALSSQPCAGTEERPVRAHSGLPCLAKTMILPLANANGKASFFLGTIKCQPLSFRNTTSISPRKLGICFYDIGAGTPQQQKQKPERSILHETW